MPKRQRDRDRCELRNHSRNGAQRIALKLRRRTSTFTNRRLPQKTWRRQLQARVKGVRMPLQRDSYPEIQMIAQGEIVQDDSYLHSAHDNPYSSSHRRFGDTSD